MFDHGLVEGLFYVCEAYILCLSPNVLKLTALYLNSLSRIIRKRTDIIPVSYFTRMF